jgi:hypothetical protein
MTICINLLTNMMKLTTGWSSSTDLHENLYRLFACRANALCRKKISTAEKDYSVCPPFLLHSRSRIHERTISLRFLGIIFRVLRLNSKLR